jgi:parvulin-like peptidyl-prolyl isomerase
VAVLASSLTPAISNGDVILIVVLIAIPVAAIAFIANAGSAFKSIGKGGLSVEFESDNPQGMRDSVAEAEGAGVREDELRQMLEAKAYRQTARGETPLDVDSELDRLLNEQRSGASPPSDDPALRAEVRQLVVARNERRERQGKEPLDVEAEVDRQLRELENLGQ